MDTSEMVPGRKYIIDGKLWAKCGQCGKVLQLGWFSDIHLCVARRK